MSLDFTSEALVHGAIQECEKFARENPDKTPEEYQDARSLILAVMFREVALQTNSLEQAVKAETAFNVALDKIAVAAAKMS